MALSDSEVLDELKAQRDALLTQGQTGVISYTIRGRTVQRRASELSLKSIQDMIRIYEGRVNAASGHVRTYGRIGNR